MKKILLSLVALVCAMVSFAQTNLVATLTHGDEIKMFYGAFAFRNAHNNATNGDVINLSGGSFQAVTITKAIAIRGTGVDDANPTLIDGDFDINIPTEITDRLSFEGCQIANKITVKGTLKNAYFLKCSITRLDVDYFAANMVNCNLVNCQLFTMGLYGSSTVHFVNSRVENFVNNHEGTATATFLNCVIRPNGGCNASKIGSCQLTNCILCNNNSNPYKSLPSTSSAINCVAVGNGNAFSDVVMKQNCSNAGFDMFQNSDIGKDLTDEAKAKYLGNDGTPVGMYGGILPYNMTPSYPRISKMNVASKTTADGKLSVEIEVSAAQ